MLFPGHWTLQSLQSKKHVYTVKPGGCFTKLVISYKWQFSVISYWNPCFWLVISRFITAFCHLPLKKGFVKQVPAFSDLSTKTTFFVSLENGFTLKHVLKEPIYTDHLYTKTTFCVSLGRSFLLYIQLIQAFRRFASTDWSQTNLMVSFQFIAYLNEITIEP